MKNKHIKLVKKWLEDNDSVSPEELKENSRAALSLALLPAMKLVGAYDAASDAAEVDAASYVYRAACFAYDAACYADADAAADASYDAADAAYWVERYEELTK